MQIAGESMFNDGVAIVLYSGLLNHVIKKPYLAGLNFTEINGNFSNMYGQAGAGFSWNAYAKSMVGGTEMATQQDDSWFIVYLIVLFCKMFFGGVLVGWLFGVFAGWFIQVRSDTDVR